MAGKTKLALPGGNAVKRLTAACALLLSASLFAQYDDASTEEVNEGRWGSGYDDPFTERVNEGAVGSGYDDPFTDDVNEGAIGSGYDDPFTPEINEGAIGEEE